MNRDEFEVNNNTKETETNIQPSLTEQVWSVREFFLRDERRKSRAGKLGSSCPLGSQSERRIRFIFPACGFSHIILLVRILCLVLVLFRGWWTQYFSFFYSHPGESLEAYPGRNFLKFSKENRFFLQMSVKRKELVTVRHTKADILTVLRKYLHPIETLIWRFNSPNILHVLSMLMNNNRSRSPKVPICDITLRQPFPVFWQ